MKAILLLLGSNLFMTVAWYGHLKHQGRPLLSVIIISWGIAFFEYCLQVPANRLGIQQFSVTQLKTIQEIITLAVFCVFSYFYFGEKFGINQIIGFACLILAAFFIFKAD
jgi:uncharacterized protein (DUF486 family)